MSRLLLNSWLKRSGNYGFKDLINATGEGASALIQMASDADREREKLASDSSFFD